MSSEIKVTNIKHSSSGSNNLVLASDGSATINQISSSTVFPAGHILQVKEVTLANFNTSTTTGELGVFENASSSFTISSGNHVLVQVEATVFASRSSTSDVYATISEGTHSSIGDALANSIASSSQGDNDFHINLFAMDTSPASTTPQYVFTIQRNTSGTAHVKLKSGSTSLNKMVLMEIKQ